MYCLIAVKCGCNYMNEHLQVGCCVFNVDKIAKGVLHRSISLTTTGRLLSAAEHAQPHRIASDNSHSVCCLSSSLPSYIGTEWP